MFEDIFNTLASEPGRSPLPEVRSEEAPAEVVEQPQEDVKSPTDLSNEIGLWLDRAISLAESHDLHEVADELKVLDTRSKLPGFRIAFVGEFNRGKSTLINRILDRRLLPVRVLPTTDTVTAIVAGPDERMEVRFPDGRQEVRRLEKASWSDLIVNEQPDKPQEVFPYIRLTLDDQWLREVDVEIIDTPGVGDLNDRRSALVSDVLGQSDAAVLLVSAVLPFSISEAAFLEQEVLGRHIPLVLVVVSKLDTLSEDQQSVVLEAVRNRVAQVSPLISVLPAHPIDKGTTEAEAIDSVRSQIKTLVSKADRRAWRSRQAAAAIADHLNALIELGQTAITAAQMSEVKREEVRRKAREEAHLRALQWEKIYLELDKRRLRVDQELRRRLSETRGEVVKVISFELAKTSDPKSWWERKLPVRLRQEFLVLAQGSEAFLIESLARDTKWLQNEVNRVFSTRMNQGPRITTEPLEPISDVRNIALTDIERQRLYTRIGSGAAMIAGYLLIGPIGSAIGIATVALGEYFFNKQVEEQRRHLKEELGRSIDRAVEEYSSLLSQRLQTLYHQIAQDMKRKQTVWEAAKDAAIKASGDVSDERIWQQLIAEAATLRHDILTSLEK